MLYFFAFFYCKRERRLRVFLHATQSFCILLELLSVVSSRHVVGKKPAIIDLPLVQNIIQTELLTILRMPIFHSIEPKDIWLGDHLYIWSSILHQHHGIVLFVNSNDYDQSEILEFNTYDGSHKSSRAIIQKVPLKRFRENCTLKRVVYGSRFARLKLAGTAYSFQCLEPELVVDKAQHILEQITFGGGFMDSTDLTSSSIPGQPYHLILRNCECLAFWCKTGMWYSEQVEKVVHWIATPLVTLLKAIADYVILKDILSGIGQEAVSEVIESSLCDIKEKFCSTLAAQGIGTAIMVSLSSSFSNSYFAQNNTKPGR